ncbi:MAG: GGDEF domain-containing protein [Lachnospiraceae bacterium]|nr:GGDEF domain-containing protein [Lachnospiraceae bacterium]
MEIINGTYFLGEKIGEEELASIEKSVLYSLLDDHLFFYYHDIPKDMKMVKFLSGVYMKEIDDAMKVYQDVALAFKSAIDKFVHPEDRKTLTDIMDPDYYIPLLRGKKSETIYYRWRYDNRYYLYNRLVIKKLDDPEEEPTRVAILCTDVDSQVRERLMLEEIHKRYVSGVNALSREYASVYFVNLDTKELIPFGLSDRIEGMFGDSFYHVDYDRAVEDYVDNAVLDEDKERMREILSRDYVRRNLINQDYFTRIYLNNDNCYCEMKCVKVAQEDASNVVIMGFAVKDEEIRTMQEHKKQKDFQLSLLDGLTRDYHTVFLVKPGNIAELYRTTQDEFSEEYIKYRTAYSEGYNESVNFYIDKYVLDEDKERLRNELDFDHLTKSVPESGIYTITYKRTDNNGGYKYIRICVSKAVAGNGEVDLVIGFRDVDTLVRGEIKRQNLYEDALNERDMDGLTGLRNRYCFENRTKLYPDGTSQTIGCIYIDADGLHEINNEQGHDVGDMFIKTVADRVRKIWGKDDTFRIGGDEFVAFVFDASVEEITGGINDLKVCLKDKGFSASVGYSIANREGIHMRTLIKEAEDMMYLQKKEHYKGANDRRRNKE